MNWLLSALLLVLSWPAAQSVDEDREALTKASAKLEALREATGDEDLAWKEAYNERVRLLESLIATGKSAAELPDEEQIDREQAELEQELEPLRLRELPTELQLEAADERAKYEQAAGATAAARAMAQSKVDELETRAEEAEVELAELPGRGERARARGASLGDADEIARYRQDSVRLETRLVAERASYLATALASVQRATHTRNLRLERATLLDAEAQRLFELAREEATRLREEEARATRDAAEAETRRAARESDPLERFRHQVRAEAGNLRAASKDVETRIEQLTARLAAEHETTVDLTEETKALNTRLELQPRDVDTLLRRHLERARRAKKLIASVVLPELEAALDENQLALAAVLDRQWVLGLPDDENEALEALVLEAGEERREDATQVFHTALEEDGLLAALDERADQLEKTSGLYAQLLTTLQERHEQIDEFVEYLEAQMLWTRSDVSFGPRVFTDVLKEIARIPAPYAEAEAWRQYGEKLGQRFPACLVKLGLVAGLALLTRRLSRWREIGGAQPDWAQRAARVAAGLLYAAGPSLQLWGLMWAVYTVSGPDGVNPPLATMLGYQAAFVLARRMTRLLLGHEGLLIESKLIDAEIGLQIVRSMRTVTLAGQVFYAPYRVLIDVPFRLEFLPRVLYVLWALMANIAALRIARRRGAIVRTWTREGGLLRSVLRILVSFWSLALLPLLTLDLLGYRVGVERTMLNAVKIFAALFVLGALYRVLERLGLRIARSFAGKTEQAESAVQATRSLVRVASVLMVIVVGLALRYWWEIGGPLTKLFVGIQLFEYEPDAWLTLWDVWVAVAWIVVGHLLSANLRGLHDLLTLPFEGGGDEGSRYAFLAVTRYVVIAVAYAGALITVGFSFEALGWFATATSVGLGFGLQEIVANFISGLILLFEQPIRVGDIVTIGTTSGTVDSISMRATVITNWERQTIIVPNKRFITENLTNWTSHDKIMRRELELRVTYGTDVEHVIEVTDEVVRAHPAVLGDPAPRVWFQAFGVVGIEFKVLFFTSIDQGLGTRSEIHRAINARFIEEGIQIPSVSPEDLARAQQEQRGGAR